MMLALMAYIFQSTLLQEERRDLRSRQAMFINFNPRSYKRSDLLNANERNLAQYISIHAPTRGATVSCLRLYVSHDISIHAPTRGATMHALVKISKYKISIHAPTRGATSRPYQWHNQYDISIHAPTRGATNNPLMLSIKLLFQSTLLQEERLPKSA